MKKVLFVATTTKHITTFHIPYLKMFKEKGYEVHVASNGDEPIEYCDKHFNLPFARFPLKFKNLKTYKQLKKIIDENDYEIIHSHTPVGGVLARLAAKKARKKGTRSIYTAHGFHFYKGAPVLNWILYYPVEWYLAKYTTTLITINKEDYNIAKKRFKKRCSDIQYVFGVGLDKNKFDFEISEKEKRDLRASLGIHEKDFVIIYPAELSKRKRQIWLIETMHNLIKKYNNIHILLPGADSLKGKCQELTNKLQLCDNIHFLGFRKDIPKLLKISNLAISTASQEGLPVNIMEAIFVGLPVVASNCRGNNDLVCNDVNGYLVNYKDSKEFQKSVEKCYLNRNCKLENNKLRIIDDFLIENVINKFNKIYFSVKSIAFIRSTAIYNDSRATKEINSYCNNNNSVIVLGWNRNAEDIKLNSNNYVDYNFYNLKANYGSGVKSIFKIIKFNLWIKKQLIDKIDKIDIIHACDFDTALIARYISKKYNKKFIYDIYDYYVESHNVGILKKVIEKMDINAINDADYVLICTEKRKKQISKARPKNICIVYNSPYYMKVNCKKDKKNRHNKIIVGYFGILQDNRLLLEISREIINNQDIILHIGGFGKYEKFFEDLSQKYSNVIFYGTLNYEEVLEKELECDFLFATYNPDISNHKYSAPNKVFEAMALNIPVIVCKNTGIDDMVIKEKIGYAIDYNSKEFIKCLRDKKEYNSKKESDDLFKTKYSWEVMDVKINRIIKKMREKI